ncbi:hypothetical protein HA052_04335 [Chromobacterium haemolyticum]|uniref:Uncharacterized protein n=1 Tax=Chromobacterium fluminis TaxID=3044269 RepID=A0ABX0L0F4_9NEIS|nr:hypothetical protein [Chromobacterium haemolyticum]NHR04418.1 hypothetical protein [Chromobacterium haemolyticum]
MPTDEEQALLDLQVADWTMELQGLAGKIATAKGRNCAIVLIEPKGEGYEDVCPQLIVEDALGVLSRGWPSAFSVTILNRSD